MERARRIPLHNIGLIVLGLFGLAWISLEGAPRWSAIMAFTTLLVGIGILAKKFFSDRRVNKYGWIVLFAGCGLAVGLLFAPATLLFMAIKTGLHGHGTEFTRTEIEWFLDRVTLWTAAGLMAGVGLGLLTMGLKPREGEERSEKL